MQGCNTHNLLKMKFYRLLYISLITITALACKKDDETITYPNLDGNLTISGVKSYISAGETLTMTPKGLTHPDGKNIGYYWKVSKLMDSSDTTRYSNGLDKNGIESDGSLTFTFPSSADSLDTYKVYCYAFAEGYTGQTSTFSVTTVKGGIDGSIKGISFPEDKITTSSGEYFYKAIGSQTWILNNLVETGTGLPYDNLQVMSDVYGRFYNYDEAKAVCENLPANEWKLPSKEDWEVIISYITEQKKATPSYGKSTAAALMANATFNGNTMWEYWPVVGNITNSSGFSAIPAGYSNIESEIFKGTNSHAAFWTATESDEDETLAYCIYVICDSPEVHMDMVDKKSFGATVRCVRK